MDNDRQMEFLFEEGGIADDGMERDPVSGNEVPAGSLAKEVRDDIPAQLSEGEYVVPADVVRYYGVKYFEDLREEAKEGLGEMEEDGRIGGEPVDMEEDDLTPEEMAELESIMGMAMGGVVPQQNMQQPDPYQQQAMLYQQQQPRGYQEGGQVSTDFSRFAAGFSFMGDNPGQTMPTMEPVRTVTLYGPNGEITTLQLPAQQALYDDLISQGYSTQPPAQTATPQVQTMQQGGDEGGQQQEPFADQGPDDSRFGSPELTSMMEDPLQYGRDQLDNKFGSKALGVAGSLAAGPVGGLLGASAGTMATRNSIAEAKASALMAEKLGYDASGLNTAINERMQNLSLVERSLINMDDINERAQQKYQEYLNQARDPSVGGGIGRDSYVPGEAGDEAFQRSMEEVAPAGMTYNPSTGGYTRTGSAAPTSSPAPTRSPVPAPRPSTVGDSGGRFDSASGGYEGPAPEDRSNVGGWFGDRDQDGVQNWRDFNDGVGVNDKNQDGGGSSEGSGKIVCTAMNASYGFGSYRQAIWLRYSEKHLTGYHEKGYHKIFLPLVDRAYNRGNKNSKLLRKVLENIARHRTADLRAEMQGKKRDIVGRIYRAVLEPLCYIVGRLSKK
jgi:hypothetical protein